jgi:hypothetical protein
MMSKFSEWFGRNRKPIGYTIGVLNLLVAANYLFTGNPGLALVWFILSITILFDTYEFK